MKHNICHHEWLVEPSRFIQGGRCPRCKESHGELSVRDFLNNNHITFESQYKISECKDLRPLPFDFAIFIQNKLVALIEYQGRQHYHNIDFCYSWNNQILNLDSSSYFSLKIKCFFIRNDLVSRFYIRWWENHKGKSRRNKRIYRRYVGRVYFKIGEYTSCRAL